SGQPERRERFPNFRRHLHFHMRDYAPALLTRGKSDTFATSTAEVIVPGAADDIFVLTTAHFTLDESMGRKRHHVYPLGCHRLDFDAPIHRFLRSAATARVDNADGVA